MYSYPADATPVCVFFDIKSAVILCICPWTDISATVQPIGVEFCTMVELRPGSVVSPSGGDIFRGLQMRGEKNCSGGQFLCLSDTDFCQLTANISKTVAYVAALHVK